MAKKIFVTAGIFALLGLLLCGCDMIPAEEEGSSYSDDLSGWEGSWSYSEVVRGQGTGHVGLSLSASGIYGFDTTTLYYLYQEKETATFESQLDSQLDALESQYVLGLITRQEYESEAEHYYDEYYEKCAPVFAKYKNTSWGGTLKEDSSGYYMNLSGKKYYMEFLVNTIVIEDPVTGGTYFLEPYF